MNRSSISHPLYYQRGFSFYINLIIAVSIVLWILLGTGRLNFPYDGLVVMTPLFILYVKAIIYTYYAKQRYRLLANNNNLEAQESGVGANNNAQLIVRSNLDQEFVEDTTITDRFLFTLPTPFFFVMWREQMRVYQEQKQRKPDTDFTKPVDLLVVFIPLITFFLIMAAEGYHSNIMWWDDAAFVKNPRNRLLVDEDET